MNRHDPSALAVPAPVQLVRHAECSLPTRAGNFRLIIYRSDAGREPMAIIAGDPAGEATLARVHSECWPCSRRWAWRSGSHATRP